MGFETISEIPAFDKRIKPEWGKKWMHPMVSNLDFIHLNYKDLVTCQKSFEEDYFMPDMFENPALKEFAVEIVNDNGVPLFDAKYKKTIMDGYTYEGYLEKYHCKCTCIPFVDVHIRLMGCDSWKLVLTLLVAYKEEYGIRKSVGMVAQTHCVTEGLIQNTMETPEIKPFVLKTVHNVKVVYASIQYLFKHRPTCFVEATSSRPHLRGQASKPVDPFRKVNYARRIVINADVIEHIETTVHYEMQCPCWGVVGHWREYKSGKRIWIKPYKKGKQRNNPSAYSPKEYQI